MAALYTTALAAEQRTLGVQGAVLEIGVFKGKYLAVLYHASRQEEAQVVGIDAFIGSRDTNANEQEVHDNLASVCGDSRRLKIITADSTALSTASMQELVGGSARLISIDGGHTLEVVSRDLSNCVPLLSSGGVIALDDFFNHGTPEVTEALLSLFREQPTVDLVPFAHCYNKLFLTTRAHHGAYLEGTKRFLQANADLSGCARTLTRHRENTRLGFRPQLLGAEIWPFF